MNFHISKIILSIRIWHPVFQGLLMVVSQISILNRFIFSLVQFLVRHFLSRCLLIDQHLLVKRDICFYWEFLTQNLTRWLRRSKLQKWRETKCSWWTILCWFSLYLCERESDFCWGCIWRLLRRAEFNGICKSCRFKVKTTPICFWFCTLAAWNKCGPGR